MISLVMPFVYKPGLLGMTEKTIQNIRETTREPHEIILVQQEGPIEFKDSVDKHLYFDKVLFSLGMAYNLGFKQSSGDVFVNIHNDVVLPQDWDAQLSDAARRGYIGCVFTDESDSDCELRGVHKGGLKYIPSCCFSVSRETWEKLGGYDEKFKGYHWEDNDLFLRAAQAGGGPVRCDVIVKHKRGMTRSYGGSKDSDKFLLSNKDRYYQKHYDLFKDSGMYILTLPDYANFKPIGEEVLA